MVRKRRCKLYFPLALLLCIIVFISIKLQFSYTKTTFDRRVFIHDISLQKKLAKDQLQFKNISNFKNSKTFQTGLVLDAWFDVCLKHGIEGSLWHPFFPKVPQMRTVLKSISTNGLPVSYLTALNRVYGYFYIEQEGEYEIKLRSSGISELLILDTKCMVSAVDMLQNVRFDTFEEVHFLKSSHKRSKSFNDLTYSDSFEFLANFKAITVYFLELLVIGPFELYLKSKQSNFVLVNESHVFHSNQFFSKYAPYSFFSEKHHYTPRYPIENSEREKKKYNFFRTPIFSTEKIFSNISQVGNFRLCEVHHLEIPKVKLYNGINLIHNVLVYPKEYFKFTDHMPTDHLLMKEQDAMLIVDKAFDVLNSVYNRSLELAEIIHVHTNLNDKFRAHRDWRVTYYFIEIHVRNKNNGQTYQTSHFLQKPPDGGLCFMQQHRWNANAEIFLLTPVKNQYVWVKFLMKVLEDLCAKTNEKKVTLILLDNESTDGDYERLLSTSSLKTRYLRVTGTRFSKVKALNVGLNEVHDTNDNIAMVMDLHLELPLDFFDRTRKLTIRGKTAFSPTLLRLGECTHEMYTDIKGKQGKWQDDGPGIMAMYRSDWKLVGGFNEKMFANKWGGEDWELVDRIITHGLHIIHYRLPRFYHLIHSRKGMWNFH